MRVTERLREEPSRQIDFTESEFPPPIPEDERFQCDRSRHKLTIDVTFNLRQVPHDSGQRPEVWVNDRTVPSLVEQAASTLRALLRSQFSHEIQRKFQEFDNEFLDFEEAEDRICHAVEQMTPCDCRTKCYLDGYEIVKRGLDFTILEGIPTAADQIDGPLIVFADVFVTVRAAVTVQCLPYAR